MNDILSAFYMDREEPQQSCLWALRGLILEYDPRMNETLKYGMPCFCLGKKILCYLWVDRKTSEPYVLFVEGRRLNHPELEAGRRVRMKSLRINPYEDIPLEMLRAILSDAIALYSS